MKIVLVGNLGDIVWLITADRQIVFFSWKLRLLEAKMKKQMIQKKFVYSYE